MIIWCSVQHEMMDCGGQDRMGAWTGETRLGGGQLGDRRAGLTTSGGAGDREP
jgi:hypothetical protein